MNYIKQINRGKNDLWRWLLLIFIFFVPFLDNQVSEFVVAPLLKIVSDNANLKLGVLLLKSVFLLVVFYILFKLVHKRDFITLLTGRKKISWYRYFFAFSVWGILIIISFSTSVFKYPEKYSWNFKLYPFLELFLILLALVPLQMLFNVVLMRGYLYQFFAKIFKSRLIFLVVLVVLISFYELFNNNFIAKHVGVQVLILYTAMNIVVTLSTYLDDGLETVLGMKTANTFIGLLYVTSSIHPVKQDALFFKTGGPNILMLVYYTSFIACPIYLIVLSKTYNWDWSRLFNKKRSLTI